LINNRKRPITVLKTLNANIFTRIFYKINFSNKKDNQLLLDIDLLKEETKKDLLYISSQNLEKLYSGLFEQPNPSYYMQVNGEALFLNLVKVTCEEFLAKQYGCCLKINTKRLERSLYTKHLLKDLNVLFQVPFYALLDPQAAQFKKIYYPIYTYVSESFLEALIDNLIIEIANCIIFFSVVNFSFLYAFRQTLYRAKFLSLRNFERFKNNLIWQLRIRILITKPTDLYNSRYRIYILRAGGIDSRTIYANRSNQLSSLTKLSLLTISLVELSDFLISRVDETIYFLTKGLRFTLTNVVGQFIGLVWRGIIEGLKK
jgi:hypothetical protein